MENRPNRFGSRFKITTFGESHSKGLGVLIEGLKPNIEIDLNDIKDIIKERQGGKQFTTKRKEPDEIVVLSGIFDGKTLGTPIVVVVFNKKQQSKDYENLKNIFRPSHADYTFFKKYGIRDYRGGGRASGRETISRVIAGGVALSILEKHYNIKIVSKLVKIGPFEAEKWDSSCKNSLNFADNSKIKMISNWLEKLDQDSVGAISETRVYNLKKGLGDPIFEKLGANIGKAVLSIPASKGIEFGYGFKFGGTLGSEINDQMDKDGFLTNNSGGLLGGISNGEPLIFRSVWKPTPSISKKQKTVDIENREVDLKIEGRHDPILAIRVLPIINSMVGMVILDAIDSQFLIEDKTLDSLRGKIDTIDREIFLLLNERLNIVKGVKKVKKELKKGVTDIKREIKLKEMIKELKLENIDSDMVNNFYNLILNWSKNIQNRGER